MEPAPDSLLKRLSAFLLGGLLFGLFVAATLLLWPWFGGERAPAFETEAARRRVEIRGEVADAQAEALWKLPEQAMEDAGKMLVAAAPAPVKDPRHLVPGSPTALARAEEPSEPVEIPEVPEDAPVDPEVMALGKQQFNLCAACHGVDGQGMPNIGPPLAGSEWVAGPVENLIRIQLRGLTGPITVKGKEYNFPAPMAPQSFQTDEQVAAVLTYVRNSFGNDASPVTPEQVEALRGEAGKPMLTVEDLIPPK